MHLTKYLNFEIIDKIDYIIYFEFFRRESYTHSIHKKKMIINKIIRDHNISLKLYVMNTKKYLDNEVDSSLHYYEIFNFFSTYSSVQH